MKKYIVSIPYYATYTVEVDAENIEEAWDEAMDCQPCLCHYCSSSVEIEEVNTEILNKQLRRGGISDLVEEK